MAQPSRLHHITKQWSSHEGTVEYFPNKIDVINSRSYSQSTRSISHSTTAVLQLEHSSNPIQYRGDWKSTKNPCLGFVKDDIKKMNHYRQVRVFERCDTTKEKSQLYGEFDVNYSNKNDHRFYSAYNQRLVACNNTRSILQEQNASSGDINTRYTSHRLSTYQNDISSNLTVTDFVNQRYRSPKSTETSLIKQNSWESASTNNQLDTMNKKRSQNLQIDQIKRQKSCEIHTYFDTSSTYRPLQEPYPRSHRDSISSSRKQSFQKTYGNTEITIGIERLSVESSTSPDFEQTNKTAECQDFLSVNRYNVGKISLSKQRSCESPPSINDEFSYAQKYKASNYRQKSCDSPTNISDNNWNQGSNRPPNERRSSSYVEDKFINSLEKNQTDSISSRYATNVGSSHSNLFSSGISTDHRRQSFLKSSAKKNPLNRQPSVDLRDHRPSEHNLELNSNIKSYRDITSESVNNLDYLSPTRYGGTYSRNPITKQRSCEIAINSQNESSKSLSSSTIHSQRPASSSYNYTRNSFENMQQPDKILYSNKLNFHADPLVSTSSTDLRHMRKNTMIYSTGADQFLSSLESQTDLNRTSKRNSVRTSLDRQNKHLDVPLTGSKLIKQSSYDVSSSRRVCSSNSNSPSKAKVSTTSPVSEKLSKHHRKFSHDSQAQRKSIKSDKSIWSQAILSLKKKRAIFFGKRSKTRSTEKNAVDPVYHFLKCTANIDHNPGICECPCHSIPHSEILFHAHSSVNLPAIAYKSKK